MPRESDSLPPRTSVSSTKEDRDNQTPPPYPTARNPAEQSSKSLTFSGTTRTKATSTYPPNHRSSAPRARTLIRTSPSCFHHPSRPLSSRLASPPRKKPSFIRGRASLTGVENISSIQTHTPANLKPSSLLASDYPAKSPASSLLLVPAPSPKEQDLLPPVSPTHSFLSTSKLSQSLGKRPKWLQI
jgi:hypothetical protein